MKFTPIRQFNEVKKFYCIGAITISYYKPIFLNQHASIILFKIHILRMPNVSFRDFLLPEKYSKILIFSCFKTQQRQDVILVSLLTLNRFRTLFWYSVVDFEQVNAGSETFYFNSYFI